MNTQQLPTLPYPKLDSVPAFTEPGYTADQMQSYARAALAAKPCTCPSGDGSLRWPCPEHPAPAPEAAPVKVVVERERVWLKRGVQSFMLAYEAETDDERQWYAEQLRGALAAFTPDVKTAPAQAQPADQALAAKGRARHPIADIICAWANGFRVEFRYRHRNPGNPEKSYLSDERWHICGKEYSAWSSVNEHRIYADDLPAWEAAKPEAQHRPILGAADWAAQQKQEPRNG